MSYLSYLLFHLALSAATPTAATATVAGEHEAALPYAVVSLAREVVQLPDEADCQNRWGELGRVLCGAAMGGRAAAAQPKLSTGALEWQLLRTVSDVLWTRARATLSAQGHALLDAVLPEAEHAIN